MKIRQGLVSNSSSSSFVCIIKKEAFDRIYSQSSDYLKGVIDFCSEDDKVFGGNVVVVKGWTNNGGYNLFDDFQCDEIFEDEEEDEEENDLDPLKKLDEFFLKFSEKEKWYVCIDF